MPTITVLDAGGVTRTLNTMNPNGQALATDSQPVVLTAVQLALMASEATLAAVSAKTPSLVGGKVPVTDPTGLPLPAGASTSANQVLVLAQLALGASEATLAALSAKTPALGQAVMAVSAPVVIASNQTAIPMAARPSATASSAPVIGASTTAATLLAANANRKSAKITNTSATATCFLLFGLGTTITAANACMRLSPGDFANIDDTTDAIQYILSTTGSVNAQELT